MSKATEAQAFRIGRVMGAIEAARTALVVAVNDRSALPDADAKLLSYALDILLGIEQRAWLARSKP